MPASLPTQTLPSQSQEHGVDLMAPSLRRRMACWLYEGMLMFGVVWVSLMWMYFTEVRPVHADLHAKSLTTTV